MFGSLALNLRIRHLCVPTFHHCAAVGAIKAAKAVGRQPGARL